MAVMIDERCEMFEGEKKVWDCFEKNLFNKAIVYNHREVDGKEYDFCLLIEGQGVLIVEVKGWNISGMKVYNPDRICFENSEEIFRSPKKQARLYRFCMLNKIKRDLGFNPLVLDMVCYPFISKEEYLEKGLNIVSEEEFTIFKEDLENSDLLMAKIFNRFEIEKKSIPHTFFSYDKMVRIRKRNEPCLRLNNEVDSLVLPYSRLLVCPDCLCDDRLDKIIDEYAEGVKHIIFLKHYESANLLVDKLNILQENKNINIDSGVSIGFNGGVDVDFSKKTVLNIFNFQIYICEDLDTICNNYQEINEGVTDNCQDILLEKLSKITTFNYLQYKIEHANGDVNVLVEAGAGTGKTYSMVSRVAYLCNRMQQTIEDLSEELAMITFTNAAAINMKKRLKAMFKNYFLLTSDVRHLRFVEDVGKAAISTIHKFVIELLRKCPVYTGLGINFKISSNANYLREQIYNQKLSDFIENTDCKQTIVEMPLNVYELRKMLMDFSNVLYQKSVNIQLLSVEDYGKPLHDLIPIMNELIENVIKPSELEYHKLLHFENKLDLAECIVLINSILDNHPNELTNLNLRYIFIDEFQDTDDEQIKLFKKIQERIGEKCNFFIVGDLKQSIYRFRGATMTAFEYMKDITLNEWHEFYINKNYRTNKALLNDFDIIFQRMNENKLLPYEEKDRLSSDIVEKIPNHNMYQETVQFKKSDLVFDRLAEVINEQKEILNNDIEYSKSKGNEYNTIALLARTNREVSELKRELKKRGIEVVVQNSGNLYQLPSTTDLYQLLQALVFSKDNSRLVGLMESNYIRTKFDYQILKGYDENEINRILYKFLNDYFMKQMNCSFEQILKDVYTKPILSVIKNIYDKLGPWKNYSANEDKQKYYMSNYSYLLERIIKYSNVDSLTINELLENLRIPIISGLSFPAREVSNDNQQGISVIASTIHKSKGLEYGTVILPYTNNNLLSKGSKFVEVYYEQNKLAYYIKFNKDLEEKNSNYQMINDENEILEEESRILYVALTRAIRNCIWFKDDDCQVFDCWGNMLGD